jgi:hypothetical protein
MRNAGRLPLCPCSGFVRDLRRVGSDLIEQQPRGASHSCFSAAFSALSRPAAATPSPARGPALCVYRMCTRSVPPVNRMWTAQPAAESGKTIAPKGLPPPRSSGGRRTDASRIVSGRLAIVPRSSRVRDRRGRLLPDHCKPHGLRVTAIAPGTAATWRTRRFVGAPAWGRFKAATWPFGGRLAYC